MNFSPLSASKVSVLLLALAVGCAPSDGVKELEQGKAAYEVRDLRKAEKLLEKSVSCAPQDVDRLLLVTRVKLDLGDLPAAREWMARIRPLAGGDADVRMLDAQIAWHAKDYSRAVETFTALANEKDVAPELRAAALAGLGVVEMTCENPDLARIAFLSAIRLDRRNAAAWYHLGLLYRDGFGYLEAALEQFEIFVRLEASASPRVQKVQRKIIPELKEQIARAAADRPGASKRDSAACASALAKAEAAMKKGAAKEAFKGYQTAYAADPLSYPAALGLAKAWLKADTGRNGQTKALEAYKIACSLRPSAVSTFLAAGALAARLGYQAVAVQVYSRALAANPTSTEAADGLVHALRRVGSKTSLAQAYQRYRDLLQTKKGK